MAVDKVQKPKNSKALTANTYGKLRAFFMGELKWANEQFVERFGTKATGTRHENAQKVKEVFHG